MPRTKKPRGRPSSFDREKLLSNVMELFWDRGYNSVSFNEIAQETGLTRASLYNAFTTKEALFLEALTHYFTQAPTALLAEIKPGDPVGPAFYKVLIDSAEMYTNDQKHRGCMGVNCMNELMAGNEALNKEIATLYQSVNEQFINLVKQAIKQGELANSKNAELTANIILVFMNGFSVFSKSNTTKKQLHRMAEQFMLETGFADFT